MTAVLMAMAVALTAAVPAATTAQPVDEGPGVITADLGYARTWDDEGLLGTGASVTASAGYRLRERWAVRAIVSRVPYHVDHEAVTIDGRFVFVGGEAVLQGRAPKARPYLSLGAGVYDDDNVWITRTPSLTQRSDHHQNLGTFTVSSGVDVKLSEHTSIVAGLRFYGLLKVGGGRDEVPRMIIQPAIGIAWRP